MPSDPGAPNGASLTKSETVEFADVDSGFGYPKPPNSNLNPNSKP